MGRILSTEAQLSSYEGEYVELTLWCCDDYEDEFEVLYVGTERILGEQLKVVLPEGMLERIENIGVGYPSDDGKHFLIEASKVIGFKKGKPHTDPKDYAAEAELAVELFGCKACEVPAGTPCIQETHFGRVDKLRFLRAYCQGRT